MRTLSSAVITELQADRVRPFMLLEGQFSSGMLNVWSGVGSLSWDSKTWTGVGSLGSISSMPETAEVQAVGVKVALTGIPADLIGQGISECRQGYPITIYLGFLTDTNTVIADPFIAFSGMTDTVEISEGADTATITISVESRMIDLQRARESHYTDEEQRRVWPGDKGFEFVPSVQDWNGAWGKKP